MAGIITANVKALPRDIDVTVNVSKPQTESTTDFSVLCFVTPDAPFDHDAGRIRYYQSLAAVKADFAASSEAVRAATDFFAQSPRARTMAVGKVFTDPQPAFLQGGVIGTEVLATWKAVTDGEFAFTLNGVAGNLVALDFHSITKLDDIADVINSGFTAGGYGATIVYNEVTKTFRITTTATGDTATISKLSSPSDPTGTVIAGADFLNMAEIENSDVQPAYTVPGYTPTGIADELDYIKEAAGANKKFVYGWCLDKVYRDSQNALDAAAWAEAQISAILGLTTNIPTATVASSTTDVGAVCNANGYHRTYVVYHNNPYYYPEVAILAYALHVNYAGLNTTITTKFKDLFGIPVVPVNISELYVLNAKRINTFTLVGNNSRTFREGVDSNESWFMDDLINLDNFREDLQVAVYNVFLRNKKVPYNYDGVTMLRNAMTGICDRYVKNGTLSERPLTAEEAVAQGRETEPPYIISFADIADMTPADRAMRVGPPAQIKLNLAGAIHSLTINVEAYA